MRASKRIIKKIMENNMIIGNAREENDELGKELTSLYKWYELQPKEYLNVYYLYEDDILHFIVTNSDPDDKAKFIRAVMVLYNKSTSNCLPARIKGEIIECLNDRRCHLTKEELGDLTDIFRKNDEIIYNIIRYQDIDGEFISKHELAIKRFYRYIIGMRLHDKDFQKFILQDMNLASLPPYFVAHSKEMFKELISSEPPLTRKRLTKIIKYLVECILEPGDKQIDAIYNLIPLDEFGDNNIAFIPGFNALPDSPISLVNVDEKETMENPFYYLLYTIIQHYKLSNRDIHIILDMLYSNISIEREPLAEILWRTQKLDDEDIKEKYEEVKEGEVEW